MDEIKAMIKADIQLCDDAIAHPQKSHELYILLKAKYTAYFPDFEKGMTSFVKVIGSSNYVMEIKMIKQKLEAYLLLDPLPITALSATNRQNKTKRVNSTKLKKNDLLKTVFSTYKIVRQIGQGGNVIVYEVADEEGHSFAAKIVEAELLNTEKRKRLKNEIHFCEMHQHNNVIHVEDDGIVEKSGKTYIFYIMPIYKSNLRPVMNEHMPADKIIDYFLQICGGLEYAHRSGCIHRDLKPENILVGDSGICVVADFGIAHFESVDKITSVETKSTSRLANFDYHAPEQTNSNGICTSATDIYALGLILNEMFTGIIPRGTNYKRIGAIDADYGFLDEMVDKMISQNQNDRYQSIHELLIDFNARLDLARRDKQIAELSKPIVCEDIKDKIYNNPITIIDMDVKEGVLYITLSDLINIEWEQIFYHDSLNSYMSSPCCYKNFSISGRIATYRLYDLMSADDALNKLISDFKDAIKITNEKYRAQVERRHKQAIENEIERRQREIERLENEQNLRNRLKKFI